VTTLAAEVVVIGAGPAGAAISAELARRGREVLLVDRATFPRPKACGECLNPGAVAVLDRLRLLSAVRSAGSVDLTGWSLMTSGGRSAWAGFPGDARALGIERSTFDAALLLEARGRGVKVLESTRVQRVAAGALDVPARASAVTEDGSHLLLEGDVLVGADGLRSVVARELGLRPREPRLWKASLSWRIRGVGPSRDRGRLFLGGKITVGLAPVPDRFGVGDRWNATLVLEGRGDGTLRSSGWDLLRDRLDHLSPPWLDEPTVEAGPWGSGPFDWPTSQTGEGRTILVGDAAGYYDPLTGQGIFRALRGAELAAEAVDRALGGPSGKDGPHSRRMPRALDYRALAEYQESLRRAFATGRRLQGVVEAVVSRPAFREPLLAVLGRWPAGGRVLAGLTGDLREVGVPRG